MSEEPRFAWHDHRIHYMAPGLHPAVTDPGRETLVLERWEVPVRLDGRDLAIVGQLRWVPGPSSLPWPLLGLALTLPALAGLRTRPIDGRWPGLVRPAAVVLGAVVAVNALFVIDDLFAVPLPSATMLWAATQTALFLAIGTFGAVRGWQAADGAFTALGWGATAVFAGQGLLLWPVVGASQLSSVFPATMPRLAVGLSLAQLLPLGVVAFLGSRRLLPDRTNRAAPDRPAAADA